MKQPWSRTEAEAAERATFDEVATVVSRHIKGTMKGRRTQMVLLREALRRHPTAMPRVLDELFALTKDQKKRLEDLVDRTPLANLIEANTQTMDRLDCLAMLRSLLYTPSSRRMMTERDQLHRILEKELWIFGDEYSSAVSEAGLSEVLERHLGMLADEETATSAMPRQCVVQPDGRTGRVDLMLSGVVGGGNDRRHLIVELKRPNLVLGDKEVQQVRNYAFTVTSDQRFKHDARTRWDFWLVGNDISPVLEWQLKSSQFGDNRLQDDGRVSIRAVRWGDVLDASTARLREQQERLNYASSQARVADYAGRAHGDSFVVPLLASAPQSAGSETPSGPRAGWEQPDDRGGGAG